MNRKQAAPDYRLADEYGVASFIPPNRKRELRANCSRCEDGTAATHEVEYPEREARETVCEVHVREIQITASEPITVRRRKRF